MSEPPVNRVRWRSARRLISTRYPPIDLFEDISAPEDWDALILLEQRTNPRLMETVGHLDLIPPERRVGGVGASYVMGPLTHVSEDSKGRFHDGKFGAYYTAARFETALSEKVHHQSFFFKATNQTPGWFSEFRELVGAVDHKFHDIRDDENFADMLDPDDWEPGQTLARQLRSSGSDGIVYPSVRDPNGICLAAFWPDTIAIPQQGRSIAFHFDGERVDMFRDESSRQVWRLSAL